MAKYAPVVPLSIAKFMQTHPHGDLLGGYHLLLAHDILAHPAEYQDVYHMARRLNSNSFIILDNSIVELGKAMDMDDLITAAGIIKPDCIVMPDVMGEGLQTRKLSDAFYDEYVEYNRRKKIENGIPLMGVLQGSTIEDAIDTAVMFRSMKYVDYLGVPRILAEQHGSRMPLLLELLRREFIGSFLGIHLLGFSDNILDDVSCARLPFVQGIDSTVPVRAATAGKHISLDGDGWNKALGKRRQWWDEVGVADAAANMGIVEDNVRIYRTWINPSL